MLLSTTTCRPLTKGLPLETVVKTTADAGFDAFDFNFCLKGFRCEAAETDEFNQMLLEFKSLCDNYGLVINQAHAPFVKNISVEETRKWVALSMKQAAMLGAPHIVVHPLHHLRYENSGVPEQLFQMNMEYYTSLIPYCEEYGIKIAVENMWQRSKKNQKIIHSVCSTPDEFCRYLDNLDKNWFIGCLDIGHAILNADPARFIRALGHNRLKALHVHDSDGFDDSHTLPYHGIGNWNAITEALHDINYSGDFTFETVDFEQDMPAEVFPQTMNLLGTLGRHLMEKIEK